MNQFGDNPYQSPEPIVRAELVEKAYQPPRAKKPWPPIFSMAFLVTWPFVFVWGVRFLVELNWLDGDNAMIIHFLTGVAVLIWIMFALRTLVWGCKVLFVYS